MNGSDAVKFTRLDNGLRIVSESMPRLETASIGIWIDAGSRNEEASQNGIAHMLEHMAFKGTKNRSARDIAESIEDVGASLNAYTSREQTAYYARMLADDTKLVWSVLEDILQNSTFDGEELAKEKQVIIQEIGETSDTPTDLIFDHFQETAFPDQPVGRPILGREEIVAGMPQQGLFDYVQNHYIPENTVVAAAGKVDHDELLELVGGFMADIPARPRRPVPKARYRGGVHFTQRELEQTHLVVGWNSFSYRDPDFFALQLLVTGLGGGMSSRLFQKIREEMGLCYSIFCFSQLQKDSGTVGIYAGTSPQMTDDLLIAAVHEAARSIDDFTHKELERAKAQMKAGMLMSMEGCFATCEDIARQYLCFGEWLSPAMVAEKIDAVRLSDIKRVGERTFASDLPSTLTAIGPQEGMPDLDRFQLAMRPLQLANA